MPQNLTEASKRNYSTKCDRATFEEINAGSLQRIAAATEMMCKDREKLERDYQWMRNSRDRYRDDLERLQRKLSATKGALTKAKNKLAKA